MSTNTPVIRPRLAAVNRRQMVMRAIDVERLIEEHHPARSIGELVGRLRIAEFPHAWIKERCGLRQFRCRGRLKATLEATWASLSYNLTRWFALKRRATLPEAALASA